MPSARKGNINIDPMKMTIQVVTVVAGKFGQTTVVIGGFVNEGDMHAKVV
jgi:hypothetical protein